MLLEAGRLSIIRLPACVWFCECTVSGLRLLSGSAHTHHSLFIQYECAAYYFNVATIPLRWIHHLHPTFITSYNLSLQVQLPVRSEIHCNLRRLWGLLGTHAGVELIVFLPPTTEFWDYRCIPPYFTQIHICGAGIHSQAPLHIIQVVLYVWNHFSKCASGIKYCHWLNLWCH